MKNPRTTKRIELDAEVIADLEADDEKAAAVNGGGRGGPVTGVWQGRGGTVST